MGEIERTCGAPCVVLVIDDILYGLMVALSYIGRICPYAFLEVHVLVSRSLCVDQGAIKELSKDWSCEC